MARYAWCLQIHLAVRINNTARRRKQNSKTQQQYRKANVQSKLGGPIPGGKMITPMELQHSRCSIKLNIPGIVRKDGALWLA